MNATGSIERLSASDKSSLSRETIIAWYRAKRHEKLRQLRDEIVGLSAEKRAELKAKIIENTKKELERQKSNLTSAQRQEKAKEFADTLFTAAMTRQDLNELAKNYESQSKTVDSEKLYNAWLESKEFSPVKESPRYLASIHLRQSKIRKEAFLLLGLIEKHWDKEEAMKVYEECWGGKVFSEVFSLQPFSLGPLRKFFSKDKAGSVLGFYYGSRTITMTDFWNVKVVVTGWWTVDYDEDEVNSIGKTGWFSLPSTRKKEVKKRLKKGGYGDEYSGSEFLCDSISHIKHEFTTSQDSGLSKEDEQAILGDINTLQKELDNSGVSKARDTVLKWFKEQPKNEWVYPPQETLNLLAVAYGEGVGNYMYRYVPDKNKIYILPLKDAKVEDKYFGGYIKIENDKLAKTWSATNSEETKKIMMEYIKTIDEKEVEREITDRKLREEGEVSIDAPAQLKRTAGMVSALEGVPSNVEYSELEKGYLEIIEKKIKAELIGKKIPEAKASELASLRVKQMREKIKNLIEEDDLIKEAIEEEEKVKLEIKVDNNDEIKVSIHESGIRKKLLEDREKAEEAETSIASVETDTYKRLEERLGKYFGPATPFIMWFLDKTFKIKESISKFISGTGGPFVGSVLGALGIKSAKERVGSRKMDQSRFEKLIRPNSKSHVTKTAMVFEEDVKLKNIQVTIPQGNGIILERSMPVNLKGKGKFTAHPDENKKGGSFFSKFRGTKYMYKDSEIVIENGTTIPKGTVIPKGAKIKRINN